jgi:hypothetical protein
MANHPNGSVFEHEQLRPALDVISNVERDIQEMVLELDHGMRRVLTAQHQFFQTQNLQQRIVAISALISSTLLLILVGAHVIHHW